VFQECDLDVSGVTDRRQEIWWTRGIQSLAPTRLPALAPFFRSLRSRKIRDSDQVGAFSMLRMLFAGPQLAQKLLINSPVQNFLRLPISTDVTS
jgi:hypothetical protein